MSVVVERKRYQNVLDAAPRAGAYDEQPIMGVALDPQVHLSKNAIPQPFFLICEKDTILVSMSGDATVEFRDCDVLRQRLLAGDYVYVPAGTPHRIVPKTSSLHLRFKARDAGLEGVAWYCDRCNAVLHRIEWDTAEALPQEGYAVACDYYQAEIAGRPCSACSQAAPALDLTGMRWQELAPAIRAADVSDKNAKRG
jgi:hypothetical protein